MYIDIYTYGDNPANPHYRGLYRGNDLIDIDCGGDSRLEVAMHDYWSLPEHKRYCAENLRIMEALCMILAEKGRQEEILLFTDESERDIPEGFALLGYDICSDSMCYSPLGDGFLSDYDADALFFSGMDREQYGFCESHLNEHGLMDCLEAAASFAKYCTEINRKHPHVVESEEVWYPFAVYTRVMK